MCIQYQAFVKTGATVLVPNSIQSRVIIIFHFAVQSVQREMTDSEGRSRRSLPPRTAKRKPERDAKSGPLPKKKKTKKRVESDSDDTEDDASSVGLSFSWIGPGEQQSNGAKDYKMLEMTVEGKTSIITVGDCMLLRSTDETPPTGSSTMGSQQSRTRHKSVDDKDSDDDKEEDDDDGPEDNERESDEEEEAFVARIVRMWEVPPGRKKQLREHCMKIRARWFFKVRLASATLREDSFEQIDIVSPLPCC